MTRVKVFEDIGKDDNLQEVAFASEEKTVLVIVNNGENEKDIKFLEKYPSASVYVTDKDHNCEQIAEGVSSTKYSLSARSITTFVFNNK